MNLKDQTLYRIDKNKDYGEIDVLLKKTVDIESDPMLRVLVSLRKKFDHRSCYHTKVSKYLSFGQVIKIFTHLRRPDFWEYMSVLTAEA